MSAAEAGDRLPVAVRAWTEPTGADGWDEWTAGERQRGQTIAGTVSPPKRTKRTDRVSADADERRGNGRQAPDPWRPSVLIVDNETTTDAAQRLTFGAYRFGRWHADGTLVVLEEGIFHADDLADRDPDGLAVLRAFVAAHESDATGRDRRRDLALRSRRDFLDNVLWPALSADALIVGFNLPFDLSRLADRAGAAQGRMRGGFSFVFWEYRAGGRVREHQYRPRVRIKHDSNKRATFDLVQPKWRPPINPNDPDGPRVVYRPGFLDLRTLAFALTDRGHSLRSACEAFGVTAGKTEPGEHGRITPEYVAYARQDVAASAALLVALRAELGRHPVALDPCKAYSPASVAKAYLRAMGIAPRLKLQPDFPRDALGWAMAAYYGGRAECAIRRVPVPVVYTDVLSMYPTVNALMGLWRFHTSERVDVADCSDEVRAFLAGVTTDALLDPTTWPALTFFAEVVPDGDVLPVRADYGEDGGPYNIGVNPFSDDTPHWYAGPDLAASVLLTGKAPRVLRAFRIVPTGTQAALQPVKLRGAVEIDPAADDFFRAVIEARKRVDKTTDEGKRLDRALKTIANSGAYGIFVEVNPERLRDGEQATVAVYGERDDPFAADTRKPERPGAFCFPPVAALITAAARLVLALIERLVTDLGGTHAFCDTDSMAIVASEQGGLVPCPVGRHRMPDGTPAIKALSWADVDGIVARLAALNPYDRDAVPGSILKVEDANFDPATGERRQVWALSIAAKRYALFTRDAGGAPAIVEHKRHGLGFLLDPTDRNHNGDDETPDREAQQWEAAVWEGIVRERLGLPHEPPPFADRPAVGRHSVTSPWLLKAFAAYNAGKPYAEQVTPFNFLMVAHLASQGRPDGVSRGEPFKLVRPFDRNPNRWHVPKWTNPYSRASYNITTTFPGGGDGVAGVKSLGAVAAAYAVHPERKRLGPDGKPCHRQTVGVLSRRPVRAGVQVYVGKEADRLEERDLAAELGDVLGQYRDPRDASDWDAMLPMLRATADEPGAVPTLAAAAGLNEATIRDVLAGRIAPKPETRARLLAAAADRERTRLGMMPPLRGTAVSTAKADAAVLRSSDPRERRCAGCAAAMTGKRPTAVYCGKRCKSRAERVRKTAA